MQDAGVRKPVAVDAQGNTVSIPGITKEFRDHKKKKDSGARKISKIWSETKKAVLDKSSNRVEKKCLFCKEPMLVAPGQEAKFHKECRKYRHRLRSEKE